MAGSSLDQRPSTAKQAKVSSLSSMAPMAPARGLGFDAKYVATGGGVNHQVMTGGFAGGTTNSRTRESQPVLELQMRNLSAQTDNVRFEWYFVARAISGDYQYVWDQGAQDFKLPGNTHRSEMIESKVLAQQSSVESHNERQAVTTSTYSPTSGSSKSTSMQNVTVTTGRRTGAIPFGWIVRMFVDGKLAKVQASSFAFDQLGRNPEEMANFLKRSAPFDPYTNAPR
jgi:hypothetical protein